MQNSQVDVSSFRDPSGFIFKFDRCVYRQVNKVYKKNYDFLISSGLYGTLVEKKLMVPHEEVDIVSPCPESAYKIIKPLQLPFISYPYEWCFSQLKDAALLTLKIQKESYNYGMTLKDSSAYNVQFIGSELIFIDSLSFEKYSKGQLWDGYRQFCQHFLAPLALMALKDVRLNQLLRIHIDGIPLDLASKLLPFRSWLNFSLISHVHLHAKSQKHFAGKKSNISERHRISSLGFQGILDNLEMAVKKLSWKPDATEWGEYYDETNYSDSSMKEKEKIVSRFLTVSRPGITWDLGANRGKFSRLASKMDSTTISFDLDPLAVEKSYLSGKKSEEKNIVPLILDLMNPSSGVGWDNTERESFQDRGPADTVLALALIHHLAISNNLPFYKICLFMNKVCSHLIIEFVPKNDSQVKKLLSSRKDIFPDYTKESFEVEFSKKFEILHRENIAGSERTLYLMSNISPNGS